MCINTLREQENENKGGGDMVIYRKPPNISPPKYKPPVYKPITL